ncbi:unnamed protein product [Enterobius vermicularis]|uniref:Secreted protein n=1 Tax=Enterobius vermicularis TaxID=51028 RepID=A0A0N4UX28_ENTVE|nr:unnamed protein product [Enterobius vermicularis]
MVMMLEAALVTGAYPGLLRVQDASHYANYLLLVCFRGLLTREIVVSAGWYLQMQLELHSTDWKYFQLVKHEGD